MGNKMKLRIFIAGFVFVFSLGIAWFAGINFDTRGPAQACSIFLASWIAGWAAFWPYID